MSEGLNTLLGDAERHIRRVLFEEHEEQLIPICAMVIGQVWAAVQPPGWKPGDPEGRAPSEQEIVFALAADKQQAVQRVWKIVRGEGGTIVELELDKDGLTDLPGRIADELLR